MHRVGIQIVGGVAALLLAGCATWSTSSVNKNTADRQMVTTDAAKKSLHEIILSDGDMVNRHYQSLGDITVTVNKTTIFHPAPTREMVNDKLREKGAELDADAVILVRYGSEGVSLMSWGSLEGKGRAIKFVQ